MRAADGPSGRRLARSDTEEPARTASATDPRRLTPVNPCQRSLDGWIVARLELDPSAAHPMLSAAMIAASLQSRGAVRDKGVVSGRS